MIMLAGQIPLQISHYEKQKLLQKAKQYNNIMTLISCLNVKRLANNYDFFVHM